MAQKPDTLCIVLYELNEWLEIKASWIRDGICGQYHVASCLFHKDCSTGSAVDIPDD